MLTHHSFLLLTVAASGLLTTISQAHQMWIESLTAPDRMVVRFGEFGDTIEKSPGYLDQLAPVLAWTPAGAPATEATVLGSTKKEDHFLLSAEGGTPAVVLAQTGFPVMGKADAPGRLPLFYIRFHAAGPQTAAVDSHPAMTLDLVPEGNNSVRVYFRSKPVPAAALTLMTGGKESSLTADAEGRVALPSCPAGPVLLTTNQKEDLAGNHLGKAYAVTSHNASLSWVSR
ncbi:MAG: hypothetical protein JWL81_3420 [Verrucomicrobiales bacterium]|nr:hypothetical protein [Verrucomicrobiales bacterium]